MGGSHLVFSTAVPVFSVFATKYHSFPCSLPQVSLRSEARERCIPAGDRCHLEGTSLF